MRNCSLKSMQRVPVVLWSICCDDLPLSGFLHRTTIYDDRIELHVSLPRCQVYSA
jgi:hypothetical protein